jgi:apolipoprotein N-acyltransferase
MRTLIDAPPLPAIHEASATNLATDKPELGTHELSAPEADVWQSPLGRRAGLKSFWSLLFWVILGTASFHAAYAFPNAGFLIVVYLFALLQLAQAPTWRRAAYSGVAVGLLIAAGRLAFFWRIFGGGAGALWCVYAFWIGLFVALSRLSLRQCRSGWGWLLVPFLWVGLEYFRSELYYLRFSWLNPGYAFGGALWQVPLNHVGVYGAGFLIAVLATAAAFLWSRSRIRSLAVMILGIGGIWIWGTVSAKQASVLAAKRFHIAGIQMEFPTESEVLIRLNDLVRKLPDTDVVVLSEYTFAEPVPEKVRQWCKTNRRYLVVGGKDPAPGGGFYNTAFVIGPSGEIVFRQVKCVPIQFFNDGRPAPEQHLWESPWGKIGICICYDLSYTRVTDRLIALGAQALIVPTMDEADWGLGQHELHGRVAPVRAAEYTVPIFRLASSGISQWVDRDGTVLASAAYPGDGATLGGTAVMAAAGKLPLDRWLGPASTTVSAFSILAFLTWCRRDSITGLRPTPPTARENS